MAITFQPNTPIARLQKPQFGSRSGDTQIEHEAKDARKEWAAWNSDGSNKTKANHASDARKDDYSRYTPANTIAPPATFHTLISPTTVRRLWDLGNTLEEYIENLGRRSLDINWIKDGRTIEQVPMAVFDTETTGLSKYDRVIQLASTPIAPGVKVDYDNEYNTLIHPGYTKHDGKEEMFKIDPSASAVHGIFPEDLADKATMEEILKHVTQNVLKPRGLLVAYNAKFDIGMMNGAIDRWNGSPNKREYGYVKEFDQALVLDPFVLIQRIHPYVSMKKTLSNHYRIIMGHELENMHDAQADVEATVDVLKYIFKYMGKHYVPEEWGEAAEKILKDQVFSGARAAEWNTHTRAEKAAFIARFVHDNRATFEKNFGPAEPHILPTDLLRFQHGYMAFHDSDNKNSNLPVFDITLNILGVDASKAWDGSDKFDPGIAEEVREERVDENRTWLLGRFKANFDKDSVAELAKALRPDLKPTAAAAKKLSATLGQDVLQRIGEGVMLPRIFNGTLPDPQSDTYDADTAALQKELQAVFGKIVNAQNASPSAALARAVNDLTEQSLTCAAQLQRELGHRYFYAGEPLTNPDKLIDPAVLKAVARAKGKKSVVSASVASAQFSGSVAELPKPRTLAFA